VDRVAPNHPDISFCCATGFTAPLFIVAEPPFSHHSIGRLNLMSLERFNFLIQDLCDSIGIPDAERILETRMLEVEGFDVMVDHIEEDPNAAYLNFHYGIVTSGRTLKVFRLLLEANLVIYAQDQAQLGLEEETGGIVMIVRVPFGDEVNGEWLVDLLAHYAEHGRYWRENIFQTDDEMFENIANGSYVWMRA
jgi:hypothetical protein